MQSLGGNLISKGIGNKIFGMPEPKVGGEAGLDRQAYMNAAFPGTTALERLGGSSQGPGNAVQAGKQQSKSQRRSEMHQSLLQDKQIASNERIASIGAAAPGRQATVAETRLEKIELPKFDFNRQKFKYELSVLKHEDQIKFEKALASYYDWEIAAKKSATATETLSQQKMKTQFYKELVYAGLIGKALTGIAAAIGIFSGGKYVGKKLGRGDRQRRESDIPRRRKSDNMVKPKRVTKGVVTDPRLLKGKGSTRTSSKTSGKPRYNKKGDAKFGRRDTN